MINLANYHIHTTYRISDHIVSLRRDNKNCNAYYVTLGLPNLVKLYPLPQPDNTLGCPLRGPPSPSAVTGNWASSNIMKHLFLIAIRITYLCIQELSESSWVPEMSAHLAFLSHFHFSLCWGYLVQGFSIIFSCGPRKTEDSSKIDVWEPNDHHCPMYFYVYWGWQRAKQVWSAGRIWPTGHHLRRPGLVQRKWSVKNNTSTLMNTKWHHIQIFNFFFFFFDKWAHPGQPVLQLFLVWNDT